MNAERPALHALATRLGILDSYRDVDGRDRYTSDDTREALVAAMRHDASTEVAASAALEGLEREDRERLLEPVLVWREWAEGSPVLEVGGATLGAVGDYAVEIRLEDGQSASAEGRWPAPQGEDRVVLPLPLRPPPGYHEIHLTVAGPGGERRARQRLVMAPRMVVQPEQRLGEGESFGICANLYSIRSPGDWGHGGLRELASLGRMAGEAGASFVGINPLHAVTNRGLGFSPYSPISRLYRNVLYLDPEAVPELADCPGARELLAAPERAARRSELQAGAEIDHAAVLDLMLPVLRELHRTFAQSARPERKEAHGAYLAREGETLRDFSTWETLAAHHPEAPGLPGTEWWRWPSELRDPRGRAVEAFRAEHTDEVAFRSWLQFEIDVQLEQAAGALRESGCALGIYQDLALGSSRASADTWMAPHLFGEGVHVGAPPDAYAPEGQDWGLPPFDPHHLRASGYRTWSRILRASFAHSGALRVDHAMGLMRLFWIPEGKTGAEGAYVSYRAQDLLGVLALESQRQAAVVVAEDLGTVPPELPSLLADWGLLRSAVLYFERDGERFRPPPSYPPRAMATVQTHDLAPLAGYFAGSDLELRRRAGEPIAEEGFEARRRDRDALLDLLREASLLSGESSEGEPDPARFRDAVHRFLASTPCVLAGVSLDDLAGEREPVNLPGLPLTAHRSWSRRMGRALEELFRSPEVRVALDSLGERRHETARES